MTRSFSPGAPSLNTTSRAETTPPDVRTAITSEDFIAFDLAGAGGNDVLIGSAGADDLDAAFPANGAFAAREDALP